MKSFLRYLSHSFPVSVILISLVLSACSDEEKADYQTLSFTFDTVHVDAKDEILFLNNSLRYSDVSPDHKHLINFNHYDHTLEVINLDELVLEQKIPFEKEGPNGTGARFSHIQYLSKDSIFISNGTEFGFYDFTGKKTGSYRITPQELKHESLPTGDRVQIPVIFAAKPYLVAGLLRDYRENTLAFAKIDLEEKAIHIKELPIFNNFKDYHYTVSDPKIIVVPPTYTGRADNKVLFSLDYTNDIYLYDMLKDTLTHIGNQQHLTSNRKEKSPPRELADIKEFHQIQKMMKEQISFTSPIWDEQKQIFYRFSFQEYDFEETESFNPKSKSHVFLSILDRDFKLIAEHEIKPLQKQPQRPFVKDGKIWMMENFDDELAFVRMGF